MPQVIGFEDVVVDSSTGIIYHVEKRPSENSRNAIVDTDTGKDLIPSPWDAKYVVLPCLYAFRTCYSDMTVGPGFTHTEALQLSFHKADSSFQTRRTAASTQ